MTQHLHEPEAPFVHEVAPLVSDGINLFAPSPFATRGEERAADSLLISCRSVIAVVPDPTWDLDGFSVPVVAGTYRLSASRCTDPERAGHVIIAGLEAVKIDVDRSGLEPRGLAPLDIDSGYAGIYIGDKWIVTRTGRGDGAYTVEGLYDAKGACVGIRLDFLVDDLEIDAALELPMTRIHARVPDPLSFRSPCPDCAVDLNKIGEGNYLVRRSLPGGNHAGRSCYCVGCVEKRIGRELVPSDFVDIGVNFFGGASERLAQRRGDHLPHAHRSATYFNPDKPGTLDSRIDEQLARRLFEILRYDDKKMTRTNGRFTEQVQRLVNEAAERFPDASVSSVLRRELDQIEATPLEDRKFPAFFADLWYAREAKLDFKCPQLAGFAPF
jgi:hypothetical protein